MKRVVLIIFLMFFILPCRVFADGNGTISTTKIFKWHIPDEVEKNQIEEISSKQEKSVQEDITSDDVTADTSGCKNLDYEEDFDGEDDYLIGDMYTDVLKGYAEYNEENEEGVELKLDNNIAQLNIKQPKKVEAKVFKGLETTPNLFNRDIYSKYNGSEYSITPLSSKQSKSLGGFSAGTTYSQEISYGELEQSSGVFTKYRYKRFAITTSYNKTVNTTNNNYNDKFFISPELQISQYLTLINHFSADMVKRRKKAEVVLSLNPFGNKDYDRWRINFSASETYDDISNAFWNQFKFSTTFKL
ncbi:hypothetical protein J6G99_01270 [bacterium]|nr:hypothetical protein [bacterium]